MNFGQNCNIGFLCREHENACSQVTATLWGGLVGPNTFWSNATSPHFDPGKFKFLCCAICMLLYQAVRRSSGERSFKDQTGCGHRSSVLSASVRTERVQHRLCLVCAALLCSEGSLFWICISKLFNTRNRWKQECFACVRQTMRLWRFRDHWLALVLVMSNKIAP